MTKKILIFLIAFVFLGTIFYTQEQEQEQEQQILEKNFQKAGKIELEKREKNLKQQKKEIEAFLYAMADDAIISKKEMKTLQAMVKEFNKNEKKFNEELSFYKLSTTIEFSPSVYKILNIYFNPSLTNYGDDKDQYIRCFFVKLIGKDILVETAKNYHYRLWVSFFLGVVFGSLFLVLISVYYSGNLSVFLGIIIFLTVFILVILIFLLI